MKFASLLATSVAFLLLFAGCEETTPQPDHVSDSQVDTLSTEVAVTPTDEALADDVSAVDDSLQAEDVKDPVESVPTEPVNYCQAMIDAGHCNPDKVWKQVDGNLEFKYQGEQASLSCENKEALGYCFITITCTWSPLDDKHVSGIDLPDESSYYDSGLDPHSNGDEYRSALWFQTTVQGDPCLTLRKIDGGGMEYIFEFL